MLSRNTVSTWLWIIVTLIIASMLFGLLYLFLVEPRTFWIVTLYIAGMALTVVLHEAIAYIDEKKK